MIHSKLPLNFNSTPKGDVISKNRNLLFKKSKILSHIGCITAVLSLLEFLTPSELVKLACVTS